MNKSKINFSPIQNTDIDGLCELLWEASVRKYLCDNEILPRTTIQSFIEASLSNKNHTLWVISNQNEWLGISGLRPLEAHIKKQLNQNHALEALVALTSSACGNGIAKLAVQKVQNYAATELELKTIYALIDTPNINSRHLFESLNYTPHLNLNNAQQPQILYKLSLTHTAI